MLRLAFDFIITWRETRTRPNAYEKCFLHNLSWRIKTNQGLYKQALICFCRIKMDNRI